MKSVGFVVRENLDVINMTIRKQTAGIEPTAALCSVNEQQSNKREQEDCSNC